MTWTLMLMKPISSSLSLSSTLSIVHHRQSVFHLFFLILFTRMHLLLGGNCWLAMIKNNRCTELISANVTRSDCCSSNDVETAWSSENLDSGALFFWRVLGGGVSCVPCKDSCKKVECGLGRKCILKQGRPKCVCAPECRAKNQKYQKQHGGGSTSYSGPVCGTDGKSYRTPCRLLKRACRKQSHSLAIAYHGVCQKTCNNVKCPVGKQCLMDQNLNSHCVECDRKCPLTGNSDICGTDGLTYKSACHLREAACAKGKAIPIAYKGSCKENATCSTIKCRDRQICLTELPNEKPRCVSCEHKCSWDSESVCGSNNKTYGSWCLMMQDACDTGHVIDTQHPGMCSATSSIINTEGSSTYSTRS